MSWSSGAIIFATMAGLALLPSVSTLTVVARTTSHGLSHGFWTTLGIVAGDGAFIILALSGGALLAEVLGNYFAFLRAVAGIYLVFLGVAYWRSQSKPLRQVNRQSAEAALFSSFMAGFLLTLADQKAILFYFAFFPAFIDLSALRFVDGVIITLLAAAAIGVAKMAYAAMAIRGREWLSGFSRSLRFVAGAAMIAVGCWLILSLWL